MPAVVAKESVPNLTLSFSIVATPFFLFFGEQTRESQSSRVTFCVGTELENTHTRILVDFPGPSTEMPRTCHPV